jgi:hypothetical protein
MKNQLVRYAEAKLLFRENLLNFIDGLGEEDLFVTNLFGTPVLNPGTIYIYDSQGKAWFLRQPTNSEYTGSIQFIYVTYCKSSESDRERAHNIADKLHAYLSTLLNSTLSTVAVEITFNNLDKSVQHFVDREQGRYICCIYYEIKDRF